MAKFNEGYKNIKVKLISWTGEDLAKQCYEFGRYGMDNMSIDRDEYDADDVKSKIFVCDLVNGKTFPKYAMYGTRINFSIEGISRICLAQLTRDNAYFCSESHGLRPLSQEFNIPLCIAKDESIMSKVKQAQSLLEEAYIEACEKELPYPETRYIALHSQTISVSASYTPADFARACYSRTNNSFCDELNYVYRKMYYELRKAIDNLTNVDSRLIWSWLINEKRCIDDSYYTRTNVFNGDFNPYDAINHTAVYPAQNDWRKSGWKLELQRILEEEPELLTFKEKECIRSWNTQELFDEELYTTYDGTDERVAKNAIKDTDYYKEHKDEKGL